MADERLRELERAASLGDPQARYRWRLELVRLGRAQEAGFEPGDVLLRGKARVRVVITSQTGRRVTTEYVNDCSVAGWPGRYNSKSKSLGVLIEPIDPSNLRSLIRVETKGEQRLRMRRYVYDYLLRTWCVGASEEETRAYLKLRAPRNPSLEWRAYWTEARDATGNWGRPPGAKRPAVRKVKQSSDSTRALFPI